MFAPRNERGAIFPLAAAGFVVAVIAASLAVDLGQIATENRHVQKVADLAALDASRDLANAQAVAERSAARNGLTVVPGVNPKADVGKMVSGNFVVDATGGTVRVTVTSTVTNAFPFTPGSNTVRAVAIAGGTKRAAFSLGSTLASANLDVVNDIPVVNRVLERLVGAPSGSINLVGFNGLASSTVTLDELRVAMGFATVNEMLTSEITVKRLAEAQATVLNNRGVLADTAAATQIGNIVTAAATATVFSTTKFRMGDMITVAQGSDGAAASTQMNVFQMLTGAAVLANGSTFAAGCLEVGGLPTSGLGVNIGSTMCFKATEAPQIYIGPEGGSVSTSQVELTFKPTIAVDVNVGGLVPLLKLSGDLPVKVTAGGATGTMARITCSGPSAGIGVTVDPEPFSSSTSANLLLELSLTGTDITTVTLVGNSTSINGTVETANFLFPGQFTPTAAARQVPDPATDLKIDTMTSVTNNSQITIVPPLIKVEVDVLADATFDALSGLFNSIEQRLVSPALQALGLSVGVQDVAALAGYFNTSSCGSPGLLK